MKKLAFIIPTVAVIAACSGGSSSTLQPGNWEMTFKATDVQAPGAPPAMVEQMKAGMASATNTQTQCITAEQAANMGGQLANASASGANCNVSKNTFTGGNIDVAATCQGPTGNMNMTMTGTYTGTEINATTTTDVSAGGQNIKVSGTVTGRRTGDCPGK